MRLKWALWWAALSLPVSLLLVLWSGVNEQPATALAVTLTAVVAAVAGGLTQGRRWFLRTLIGAPLAGAAYGALVAGAIFLPRSFANGIAGLFIGAAVGLCFSVLYLPAMWLAAWAAARRAGGLSCAAAVTPGHPYRDPVGIAEAPVPDLRPSRHSSTMAAILAVLLIVFFWPMLMVASLIADRLIPAG